MEFYPILKLSVLIIPMVPLNNNRFHGIPWNWHQQFHGIPWNSMELGVRQFRWHEQFHGISWNSMELGVRQFRWHEQFHGIPWNFKCANFADMSSLMEFHGIPWNLGCANFADMSCSMEFHRTWSSQSRRHDVHMSVTVMNSAHICLVINVIWKIHRFVWVLPKIVKVSHFVVNPIQTYYYIHILSFRCEYLSVNHKLWIFVKPIARRLPSVWKIKQWHCQVANPMPAGFQIGAIVRNLCRVQWILWSIKINEHFL